MGCEPLTSCPGYPERRQIPADRGPTSIQSRWALDLSGRTSIAVHAHSHFGLQLCSTTGRLPQAIDSFMPLVSGPQAVIWAERTASASVAADATAQLRPPANSTQARHSTTCDFIVDQARKPTRDRRATTVRIVVRDISWEVRGKPGSEGNLQARDWTRDTQHEPYSTAKVAHEHALPLRGLDYLEEQAIHRLAERTVCRHGDAVVLPLE